MLAFQFPLRAMAAAISLALVLFSVATAWPAVAFDDVPVPVLNWQSCTGDQQAGFLCAAAQVPINYAEPYGATFTLALIKHPAGDPTHQKETLFWNPGGPSDAGTQYLPVAINGFPQQVRDRFDIVSWDPRGMGGDTRPVVQCFDSAEQEAQVIGQLTAGIPDIPVSAAEMAQFFQARAMLNQICVDRENSLLAHVSTADNARDLDLLRKAVGAKRINYYGTSYGTFLGATYVNMFPKHVRSAVLDGAVYPTAWAGNNKDRTKLSTFVRIRSDIGSSETVLAFLSACGDAGVSKCAFAAGTQHETQQKWKSLLNRLQVRPVTVDGQEIDDRGLLAYLQSSIYTIRPIPGFTRFPGYAAVADFLQAIWSASESSSPSPAMTADTQAMTASSPTSTYTTSYGRQASVICGESPNPITVSAYAQQAMTSYERAGLNSWPLIAVCLGWSVKAADPYLGPWNRPTPPVLVIGNRFDPATPYTSSRRMARELFDGHFLTVQGFGHTELLNASRCAQDYIAAYLIAGTLPPDGTKCAQDDPPF